VDIVYNEGTKLGGGDRWERESGLLLGSLFSYEELDNMFDKKFGLLNNPLYFTSEEYNKLKKFSLSNGLFAYQVQKYRWDILA
jgi:hypothetical protein